MATMTVKHRVKSFETWKVAFDGMEATRREHGFLGHALYRDAADPNVVVIVNRVRDLAAAKAYGSSLALRDAMKAGGVEGAPEVIFLDDVEDRRY